MKRVLLPILLCGLAYAQGTPSKVSFEVASIKPAPPPSRTNSSWKVSDGRVDITSVTLDDLVQTAYSEPWEVIRPGWLTGQSFDLHASFPAGVTKDRLPEMMQTFLADRFALKVHHEEKSVPVYLLTVAKDGPKFRESPAGDAAGAGSCNGGFRKQCTQVTMERLARILSMPSRMAAMDPAFLNMPGALDRPVVDTTGLMGKYTFELVAGRVGGRGAPIDQGAEIVTMFDATKELGLKLEAGNTLSTFWWWTTWRRR